MLFPINDIECFAEIIGQGPPIVCLHGGFGLDHSYFRPGLDALATQHTLILLDLRGNGRSSIIPRAFFRFELIRTDLEAIRTQLGFEQWAVLGHSGGGLVAGDYLAAYPHSVSHLIIVGGFPKFPFIAPEWLRRGLDHSTPEIHRGFQMFYEGVTTDENFREANLLIAPLFFADPACADITPFTRIIHRVDPFLAPVEHYASIDVGTPLTGHTAPALILHGTHDHRVPTSEARRWLDFLPHAQFTEIPHTGHFPFIEAPVAVCDAIEEFLLKN